MTKRVVAHIPDAHYDKLSIKAETEMRSMSQTVGKIIADALVPKRSAPPTAAKSRGR